jgi:hypothetical protein
LTYIVVLCNLCVGVLCRKFIGAEGMSQSKELVAASATPMILSVLSRGESYGYAIIQEIKTLSGNEIEWTDGMLYPVLRRLRVRGSWSRSGVWSNRARSVVTIGSKRSG